MENSLRPDEGLKRNPYAYDDKTGYPIYYTFEVIHVYRKNRQWNFRESTAMNISLPTQLHISMSERILQIINLLHFTVAQKLEHAL